jgi:hypothetical protein
MIFQTESHIYSVYLCNMVKLNIVEEEFCVRRMMEHKRVAYFTIKREMNREEYKKKRETSWQSKRCAYAPPSYGHGTPSLSYLVQPYYEGAYCI